MIVAAIAVNSGMKTALVESGPLGGTCLNRGCVPSKMLIYPADVVAMIQEAAKIGINASVNSIDFQNMMGRMHELVDEDVGRQTRAITSDPRIKWYKETGEFISDYTMKVDNETIKAEKTSDTVLQLEKPPNSMTIIGGGYIAAEYGHFFSSIGTKVTIIQRNPRLVPDEEPEISELLKEELSKRLEIYTNHEAVETKEKNGNKIIVARNRDDGSLKEFSAKSLLVAIGRIPNSDILKPEKTGVDLDKRGFIKVNEYLETRKKNIWAFGDAIGKQMFKHVANYEAQVAWHNALHEHKIKMDYLAAPHAVFTHPQIASVGLKEAEAKQQGYKILVGTAQFKDTAQGAAMGKPKGFVKVILEQKTGRILGGHIIGPFASMLIQEITNAMSTGDRSFTPIMRGMHIHPAMSEVVQSAFANIHEA
jgi:dihydrolipoamide dehydrogenase